MPNVIEFVRPEAAFDPETVAVLAAAFNEAWDRLRASGSECARPAHARAMPEVVARRVIEMALHGLRDPKELADKAVRFLATNSRHSAAAGPQDALDLCSANRARHSLPSWLSPREPSAGRSVFAQANCPDRAGVKSA
jgi:hypothetical protein